MLWTFKLSENKKRAKFLLYINKISKIQESHQMSYKRYTSIGLLVSTFYQRRIYKQTNKPEKQTNRNTKKKNKKKTKKNNNK